MTTFRQRLLEKLINFYLPLVGAGIRSRAIDERTVEVEMKLNIFNRNIVGVHFGGSLYAMCDPWFMLILMRLLGQDYIVWDKAASIQFKRPVVVQLKHAFIFQRNVKNRFVPRQMSTRKLSQLFQLT